MQEVHLVYTTDDRGVLGCMTSATSAISHLPLYIRVTVWVLHTGLSGTSVKQICEALGDSAKARFKSISPQIFRGLLHAKNIPPVAYARLKMPSTLPDSVEQVLYLDIDTVVNRSLLELWERGTQGMAIAAVPNGDSRSMSVDCERLGIQGSRYFGSGVMLCDLAVWRQRDLEAKAFRFARECGDGLIMHDQDALNMVLKGDWLELEAGWNWWAIWGEPWEGKIIHYTMTPKPWDADYRGPGRALFDMYAERAGVLQEIQARRRWPNPLVARFRRRIPYWPTVRRIVQNRLKGR